MLDVNNNGPDNPEDDDTLNNDRRDQNDDEQDNSLENFSFQDRDQDKDDDRDQQDNLEDLEGLEELDEDELANLKAEFFLDDGTPIDPSIFSSTDTNHNFDELSPDLQDLLVSLFGPDIEGAKFGGTPGNILIFGDGVPDELMDPEAFFRSQNALTTLGSDEDDPIEHIQEQEDYVRNYVLPQLDREIEALQQKKAYIANQYGISSDDTNRDLSEAPALTPSQRAIFKQRIKEAEKYLPSVVKGQDHAIEKMIRSLKRAAAGTRDTKRPISSMLELGPTGVGKTMLVKELSKVLHVPGSEFSFDFLKIDCSEYSQGHESGRLKGAPPGYIGYDDGSQLEVIAENPFHVILFDEIEKANKDLHNLLLQILEDGEVTLGSGQKLSFKNCIVIMTSNIGVANIQSARNPMRLIPGEGQLDHTAVARETDQALKEAFPPEFLNRLDDIVSFNEISPAVAKDIAANELETLKERTERNNPGVTVSVDSAIKDVVVDKGFSIEFGARNIRRTVERYVANALSDVIFDLDEAELAVSDFMVTAKDGEVDVVREARPIATPDVETLDDTSSPGTDTDIDSSSDGEDVS